jgi:hypothetical protein
MHVSLIMIVHLFNSRFWFLVSFGFLSGYLVSLSKDNLQLNVLLTQLFSISNYKVLPLRFTLQKAGASTFACLFMCLACFLICMLVIHAHVSCLVYVVSVLCCFDQFVIHNFILLFYQSSHLKLFVSNILKVLSYFKLLPGIGLLPFTRNHASGCKAP